MRINWFAISVAVLQLLAGIAELVKGNVKVGILWLIYCSASAVMSTMDK